MSAGVAPCASKGEIGALLSDFLGRSAPEISSLSPDQVTVMPTTNMNNMTLAQDQGPKKRKTSENESTDSDGGSVSKKARRRKQNRVAAQTSREKKKKYLTNLESQVQALNQQNMDLQSRLLALEEENKRLKQGCSMAPSIPEPEALVKLEPMIKLEPKATAAPYYTGTGDHECLSSSMQTPDITFESAVGGDDEFRFDAEPSVPYVSSPYVKSAAAPLPAEPVPFMFSASDTFDDFSCDHREFDLPLGSFPMPVLC